ncbi:hypothetical protein C8Q78DRAFT_255517 [Trametes maxima]|nr:hypothetical protein C8Q78DRAFT_255517 [Trametes maxima]
MKFFSIIPAIAVAVIGAVSVVGQSVDTVVGNIQGVTTLSDNLRVVAQNLSAANFIQESPNLISGFNGIVATVTAANEQMAAIPNPVPFSDPDAITVVGVLTTFVQVHQALLNVVIGKHSLAAQFFLTAPIAEVLRDLEGVVDTFAFLLIDLIPTQQGPAQIQINSLSATLTETVNVYST